jgi:hypothetical protein
MARQKLWRAVRKKVKVGVGRRAEITGLPFSPGSEVEVIIVGPGIGKGKDSPESIYAYTESRTRAKKIPRYSMKQIEEIIHQSRQARG